VADQWGTTPAHRAAESGSVEVPISDVPTRRGKRRPTTRLRAATRPRSGRWQGSASGLTVRTRTEDCRPTWCRLTGRRRGRRSRRRPPVLMALSATGIAPA
jgi:hypothetical protein